MVPDGVPEVTAVSSDNIPAFQSSYEATSFLYTSGIRVLRFARSSGSDATLNRKSLLPIFSHFMSPSRMARCAFALYRQNSLRETGGAFWVKTGTRLMPSGG